jgi:uncharacterized protein YjiS (DUF1127 family)
MQTLFLILIFCGAALSAIAAAVALRAWLRFRRARQDLVGRLSDDVTRLSGRASEIQERLSAVETRAGQLPIQLSSLQRNLAILRTLTNALTTSLNQTRRVLSLSRLTNRGFDLLPNLFRARTKRT